MRCSGCQDKGELGCGFIPHVDGEHFVLGHYTTLSRLKNWTTEQLVIECKKHYYFADFGEVSKVGFLWEHCPRWYLEKVSHSEKSLAILVLKDLRKKQLGLQIGDLSPLGFELLDLAHTLTENLKAQKRKDKRGNS